MELAGIFIMYIYVCVYVCEIAAHNENWHYLSYVVDKIIMAMLTCFFPLYQSRTQKGVLRPLYVFSDFAPVGSPKFRSGL
jgi:hypothetical protein